MVWAPVVGTPKLGTLCNLAIFHWATVGDWPFEQILPTLDHHHLPLGQYLKKYSVRIAVNIMEGSKNEGQSLGWPCL